MNTYTQTMTEASELETRAAHNAELGTNYGNIGALLRGHVETGRSLKDEAYIDVMRYAERRMCEVTCDIEQNRATAALLRSEFGRRS